MQTFDQTSLSLQSQIPTHQPSQNSRYLYDFSSVERQLESRDPNTYSYTSNKPTNEHIYQYSANEVQYLSSNYYQAEDNSRNYQMAYGCAITHPIQEEEDHIDNESISKESSWDSLIFGDKNSFEQVSEVSPSPPTLDQDQSSTVDQNQVEENIEPKQQQQQPSSKVLNNLQNILLPFSSQKKSSQFWSTNCQSKQMDSLIKNPKQQSSSRFNNNNYQQSQQHISQNFNYQLSNYLSPPQVNSTHTQSKHQIIQSQKENSRSFANTAQSYSHQKNGGSQQINSFQSTWNLNRDNKMNTNMKNQNYSLSKADSFRQNKLFSSPSHYNYPFSTIINIKDFTYSKFNQIGKGSFAQVFLGCRRSDPSQQVAVKVIDFSKHQVNLQEEILISSKVAGNAHVLHLFDYYIDYIQKKATLFLEYCPLGSLQNNLMKINRYQAIEFFRQIVDGMHTLFNSNVIHRDLKLENILLTLDGQIKISDFGLSKQIATNQLSVNSIRCGTPSTMAPEIFFSDVDYPAYDHKCDVWSLGVILHELFYKVHPFAMDKQRFKNHQRVQVQNKCPIVEEFLSVSLVQYPSQRMNLFEVFDHPICKENIKNIQFEEVSYDTQQQQKQQQNNVDNSTIQREIYQRNAHKQISSTTTTTENKQSLKINRKQDTSFLKRKMKLIQSGVIGAIIIIILSYLFLIFN